MSCTNPLTAYQLKEYETETSPLVFKIPDKIHQYEKLQVPCNKCIACLRIRSLTRAIQLYCELKTTPGQSWFITFTYDDENLPDNYSLDKTEMPKLIKQIRNYRNKNDHQGKFRYEQIGEYGTQTQRPHYHMCAFNLELPDLEIYLDNGKYQMLTSKILDELWKKGSVKIIPLTMQSCLYVAQHVDKKIGGATPYHELETINPVTAEYITEREPENATRSSCPGIGKLWFEKYGHTDLYVDDFFITSNGNKTKIPAYFDKQLKKDNSQLYDEIKQARKDNAKPTTRKQNQYQNKYNEVIQKGKLRNTL